MSARVFGSRRCPFLRAALSAIVFVLSTLARRTRGLWTAQDASQWRREACVFAWMIGVAAADVEPMIVVISPTNLKAHCKTSSLHVEKKISGD